MNQLSVFSVLSIAFWLPPAVIAQEVILSTDSIPGTEITFVMSKIPGGSFMMGSPEGETWREADEGPQREITVDGFWMGTMRLNSLPSLLREKFIFLLIMKENG